MYVLQSWLEEQQNRNLLHVMKHLLAQHGVGAKIMSAVMMLLAALGGACAVQVQPLL